MVFSEEKHECAHTEAVFVEIAMKEHLPLLISSEWVSPGLHHYF